MRTFIILFFLLFCFTISMSGQKNTLSLDIEAGGLESAIDQEQWLKVHELTLTGSMNDADFYFIRDRLRTLEKLDMKNVQVDTIPVKAIYNHLRIRKIILPKELKYIGDSAVHVPYITLTGAFPALGTNSLEGSVIPSNDNEYCKLINDLVCSSDGKILYFVGSYPYLIMPEGIEHIVSKAFESSPIYQVTFPTTLKTIEENAFANIQRTFPLSLTSAEKDAFANIRTGGMANYPYKEDNFFIFTSPTPPDLQGNVFADKIFSEFSLVVPDEESVEVYKKADPQWLNFKDVLVNPESPPKKELFLEVTAGGLDSAIDQEEWGKVQELTLTGSMNDSDFYFIGQRLLALEKLDIKNVQVDTIPVKAFYKPVYMREIILPKEIKYIGDSAVHVPYIILTGAFPTLGTNSLGRNVVLSADNEYCKLIDCLICSSDGKILYLADKYVDLIMPEGIEHIVSKAFESSLIYQVTFPTTLKFIEENAFSNIRRDTEYHPDIAEYPFIFTSAAAPALEGNVFTDKVFSEFTLVVPDAKSAQVYKEADPQWSNFKKGIIYPENVTSVLPSHLSVIRSGNTLLLKSEYRINTIEIYNLSGVLLSSYSCNNSEVEIPNKYLDSVVILKITDQNGKTETLKITE